MALLRITIKIQGLFAVLHRSYLKPKEAKIIGKKWLLLFVTIPLLFSFLPFELNAQAQAGTSTATILTTADSYVDSSNPDTNYGSYGRLNVSASSIQAFAYMKFDLSAIPADAKIVNATLRVYLADQGGKNLWDALG